MSHWQNQTFQCHPQLATYQKVKREFIHPRLCAPHPKALHCLARLHLIPSRLEHNGPANVRQYLVIQDTATHSVLGDAAAAPMNEPLTTSFRGRLLCGERRRVPAECSGVVLRADEQETDKAQAWSVAAAFDDLFLWQRERPIGDADKFNVWWRWPALARAIHRPLSDAEIASTAARIAAGEFRPATRSAQSTPSKRKRPLAAVADSAADVSTSATTTSTTTTTATTTTITSTATVISSPRRSPARAAKALSPFAASPTSTPSKRKLIDAGEGKLQTPATETKAPRMTTPKSSPRRSSPHEKRRRLVRKLDNSADDDDE